MEVIKIKNRNYMFKKVMPDWDLNLQVILGDKYTYVIDSGLGSNDAEFIMGFMKDKDINKPIILINTHCHWDHIWGNHIFKNCMIIAHTKCRDMIEEGWDSVVERFGSLVDGSIEKCLPNVLFEESLYFPDDQIRLIYTPGHSEDCISILDEKEKVLNAGDNIGDTVEDIVPGLDCSKETYIKTLDIYQTLDFDTVVSGHNQVLGKDVIERIKKECMD